MNLSCDFQLTGHMLHQGSQYTRVLMVECEIVNAIILTTSMFKRLCKPSNVNSFNTQLWFLPLQKIAYLLQIHSNIV